MAKVSLLLSVLTEPPQLGYGILIRKHSYPMKYVPRVTLLGMIYATPIAGRWGMKQKTKNEITVTFVLFFLLMALLCIDTILSGEGFWYYLYFGVVIAISIPLGLLIGHLLTNFIAWCLSDEALRQLSTRIISVTRQRIRQWAS